MNKKTQGKIPWVFIYAKFLTPITVWYALNVVEEDNVIVSPSKSVFKYRSYPLISTVGNSAELYHRYVDQL